MKFGRIGSALSFVASTVGVQRNRVGGTVFYYAVDTCHCKMGQAVLSHRGLIAPRIQPEDRRMYSSFGTVSKYVGEHVMIARFQSR